MIRRFLINNQLALVFAFVVGTIAFYFHLQADKPIEIEIVVELIDTPPDVVQIYCAKEGVEYSGARRLVFNHDDNTRITGNTYRLTGQLPCDSSVSKLRFDPVWGKGHVVINTFSLKKFSWIEVDLQNEFDRSMKILNGVDKLYMAEDGLHIESLSNDPILELTADLQQHTKLPVHYVLLLVLLYTLVSFVLLRMSTLLFSTLMKQGVNIELARLRAAVYLDSMLSRSRIKLFYWYTIKRQLNVYVIGIAFVIATWANKIQIENVYSEFSLVSLSAFVASELQLIVFPMTAYLFIYSIIGRRQSLASIASAMLLIGSILYLVDANLVRLNGMHVTHGISMLFDGGVQNVIKNIQFTKLATSTLILYQLLALLSIIGSVFLAHYLKKLSSKVDCRLSLARYSVVFIVSLAVIYVEQIEFSDQKSSQHFSAEQANLPLYIVFKKADDNLLVYDINVQQFNQTDAITKNINTRALPGNKMNIYLFILESVREDIINDQVTPNIAEFRRNSMSFSRAIANGNATHYGWYSIINSRTPLFWDTYRSQEEILGSSALTAFKKAGYQINIHSAKDLSYLQSKSIMFGNVKPVYDYLSKNPELSAPEQDAQVIDTLIEMSEDQARGEGSFNAIFLDSTHYPYLWKADSINEFSPYTGSPSEFVSLNAARELAITDNPLILNRYKNSIKYTDQLVGRFIESLKQQGLYEQSAIVIVGDHGQQFMEHNFLMHGKTLFSEDIHIPLYMKIPGQTAGLRDNIANQLDIMPTLLEHAKLKPLENNLSDGRSLISAPQQFGLGFAAGMQNTPYSFVLETNDWKVMAELEARAPKMSKQLFIKRILTSNDEEYVPGMGSKTDYKNFIDKHFTRYFEKLSILGAFEYSGGL